MFGSFRLTSPHLTTASRPSGKYEVAAAMATTDNRDVPKEQIFGPIVMDRGCLRASRGMDEGSIRVWDCRHWCSWEPVPQPASKSSKVVSNGSRRLLLRWRGRTFLVYCRLLQSR